MASRFQISKSVATTPLNESCKSLFTPFRPLVTSLAGDAGNSLRDWLVLAARKPRVSAVFRFLVAQSFRRLKARGTIQDDDYNTTTTPTTTAAAAATTDIGRAATFLCFVLSLQVKALFERVESEQGRLDVLVNNAFALGAGNQLKAKFWEQGVSAQAGYLQSTRKRQEIFDGGKAGVHSWATDCAMYQQPRMITGTLSWYAA